MEPICLEINEKGNIRYIQVVLGGVKKATYLVAYTDKDDMEYKQVTCESYEDAERTVLRLEREGHMHIEEISNQEAYRGDESSYRE
ncbi:hypothetical protein [Priestia megaterium]|uniref:Uncharacterized protein n=1 Tax=Priestia megaterium TaxID=1404 RepID=A0ABD4X382_PRIMG|nr:hypothetical protein [Priestia megaterium]MDD9787043.1 hypothetical protein [Priestia megaterium]